jgi:hypothetical protein
LPQACRIYLLSLHASVAFPFNLLHLAGSYIDLERAIVFNMTLPVLLRNAVMPGRQRDLEPTLIIGGEGRNGSSLSKTARTSELK